MQPPMSSGDAVQQIKDRLDIVEVVASYVELHKAGKNFKGKSPFTNEKTPSFYVSPDRGMYYCFSSSQGGDIFTFIQAMEGVDFKGALKILADKAGVELVPEDPQKKSERDRQYDILEEATKFFERQFTQNAAAQTYLENRGVSAETRARWRIGYAPGPPTGGWRELQTYLAAQKFTTEEMLRAGLVKGADSGKEPYDVFRDRVMFPIKDPSGRVVAYSGRVLSTDSDAPKYVNSPETALFVKSDILFGYDKAKEGIRKLNFSLIVEGQFDVVLAHQAGYTNTVAVSGTALTPHHVDLLQRLSNRVVLALDNDRAGIAAMKRAADLMLGRSMDVKVAKMSGGKDPADMIQADPQEFKMSVKSARHIIEFLLDHLKESAKEARTYKLQVREEILPYVAKIPNAIDREHFEGLIAAATDTTKEAIHSEVRKLLESVPAGAVTPVTAPAGIPPPVSSDGHAEHIFAALQYLQEFPEYQTVAERLRAVLEETLAERFSVLSQSLTDEQCNKLLMQFEQTFEHAPNQVFFEHLIAKTNRLLELELKGMLREYTSRLRALEAAGELDENYSESMQAAQKINEKLKTYQLSVDVLLAKKD